MSDEYYYEDEQYTYDDDGVCEQEDTWETLIENKYAVAKSSMDADPHEAVTLFLEVVAEDQEKGRWTFKALKMLARTCQRARRYQDMITYYQRALDFQYSGKTRSDTEKAVNKFLERCATVPADFMEAVYAQTAATLERDLRTFEKLWFNVCLKYVELLLQQKQFDRALQQLVPLRTWCSAGEQAEQRKATQRIQLYAVEIQVFSERQDNSKLRELYSLASQAMEHSIAPPKVGGTIKECGGKMFMRQGLWTEATSAFGQAFRYFDDAGDARRLANLKYLVLSSMLSSAAIDPFASNETKSFQSDPEIRCMTELIRACQNNDIHTFERLLKDTQNSQSLLRDPLIARYLQPLILQVRKQVLVQMAGSYRTIKLSRIAEELSVDEREAEALAIALILDDKIVGKVDQSSGVLKLHDLNAQRDDAVLSSLNEWCAAMTKLSGQQLSSAIIIH